MNNFSLTAIFNHFDWSTSTQWYMNHMSMFPFFHTIHHGTPLSADAWLSALLISCHLAVIVYLLDLLFREHERHSAFIASETSAVKMPTRSARLAAVKRTRANVVPVPKINASRELKLAYGQHRMGMYNEALEHYRVAALGMADDINTYLVGIKIYSEMMTNDAAFTAFLRERLLNFKEICPSAWRDVANYIDKVSPRLLTATELKQ